MKAQKIYNRINEKHSNIILSAELIEQFGIIDASIKFESGKKLQIYNDSNKHHFESIVTFWSIDGNTRLLTSTIETFDEISFDSLLAPKPISLNEIVCQYRKQKNISQSELAEKIDVRQATISEFESGKHALGSDKLEAIMNALNLTISKCTDTP